MSWREREFHLLPSSPFSPLEKKKKRKESSQLSFLPLFFFMPLTSSLVNNKKEKEKKKDKCTKRFLSSLLPDAIQDTFGKEMTGKERRGRAASTSRGRNDGIFFKERETTNVLWGSSLYSSHPSLHSLPVYSTCHLPLLPWLRLHMLPTGGGRGEEEELRTRE